MLNETQHADAVEADTSHNKGKKRAAAAADEECEARKLPRLSIREEQQLKMLASAPELQNSHRDARGRRRAISLSAGQLASGALANLVSSSTLIADHETMEEEDRPCGEVGTREDACE